MSNLGTMGSIYPNISEKLRLSHGGQLVALEIFVTVIWQRWSASQMFVRWARALLAWRVTVQRQVLSDHFDKLLKVDIIRSLSDLVFLVGMWRFTFIGIMTRRLTIR